MSFFKIGESVRTLDRRLEGSVVDIDPIKDWFKVKLDSPENAISWVPDSSFEHNLEPAKPKGKK